MVSLSVMVPSISVNTNLEFWSNLNTLKGMVTPKDSTLNTPALAPGFKDMLCHSILCISKRSADGRLKDIFPDPYYFT